MRIEFDSTDSVIERREVLEALEPMVGMVRVVGRDHNRDPVSVTLETLLLDAPGRHRRHAIPWSMSSQTSGMFFGREVVLGEVIGIEIGTLQWLSWQGGESAESTPTDPPTGLCGACLHPVAEHHEDNCVVGCGRGCGCSRTQETA